MPGAAQFNKILSIILLILKRILYETHLDSVTLCPTHIN